MSGVAGLGHVGIYAKDLDKMVDFYTRVLGLTVTDGGGPGARGVFMSAHPETEHHEFVLGLSEQPTNAQQISFTVGSLSDLKEIYRDIKAEGCRIERAVSHGIAFGCYFRDPEDNVIEVYWPTGVDYPQPVGQPIDLEQSEEQLMGVIENMPALPSETPRFYGRDIGKRLPAPGSTGAR
jgi:catechol 2,3-dioxygenase-like lactoylglutathione lyase family enzyme